ncbi:hypothetical protein RBG61_11985 [Paludicola sp. MB14-C6]|uniref:hypothetical protein n=1 Tax=Paludihabitans sp. MB14-C6 TaxID=3070656 RepID=UPI0027DCED4C|nr:hypothetical protein [Paludicola sp. MB14-C6]WMJ22703.1 hypothetical protein RBG61_11985 [Paludicola sp. MB14-C6]
MKKLRKVCMCFLLVISLCFIQSDFVFAYNQPSAASYDFECSEIKVLSDTIREENIFKIKASFNYYAKNNGYWYQPSDQWVTCTDCGGSGNKQCPSCNGSGGVWDKDDIPCNAPGQPRCQSSCDGWDYQCTQCGHFQTSNRGQRNYCAHVYTAHQKRIGRCSCETGETKDVWLTCPSCNGSGTISCPSCGGSGGHYETPPMQWIPPTRPSSGTTRIDFLVDGKIISSKDVEIQINKETVNSSWEVWGTINVEAELNAGENIGIKNVEAHINWDYRNREINTSNNSKSTNINVIPATNLQVEMIEPNASYPTDTDVITTYRIINQDDIGALNIRPKHNLTAIFKALNSTTNDVISTSKVEGIVIPEQGTNIVYFKWHVPKEYREDTIKLQCEINTTKGVNETNYSDNIVVNSNDVENGDISSTPDTKLELQPPSSFDRSLQAPFESDLTYAAWEEWKWEKDWYVKKTNSASLSATANITVDVHGGYTANNTTTGKQITRSGYGVNSKVIADKITTNSKMVTDVQRCYALFKEFNYTLKYGNYRTLEPTYQNANQTTYEFYKNDASFDKCRVHFIPVWVPDGKYSISYKVSDYWTPAGMVSYYATDYIIIDGSMYNDWNTVRGGS